MPAPWRAVWEKVQALKALPGVSIRRFRPQRRRRSFMWQDWCVQAMIEGLGDSFLGTSNCLLWPLARRGRGGRAPMRMNYRWSTPLLVADDGRR